MHADGRTNETSSPRWAAELVLLAGLYIAYDATRGLRHGNLSSADRSGLRIVRWERSLHIAPEHALNQLLWHVPVLAVTSSYYYATLHFVVTPAVLVWLYRRHPEDYRMARRTLVFGTVIALVVYWLLPTTPPRLLPGGVFHDTLSSVHQWGWWSGEGSAPRGLGGLTNQLAAMPSLHVGWALWSGMLLVRHARHRSVRIVGGLYPIATALVVMATGNHYFLDAVGGAAVMAAGVGLAHLAAGQPRARHLSDETALQRGAESAVKRERRSSSSPPARLRRPSSHEHNCRPDSRHSQGVAAVDRVGGHRHRRPAHRCRNEVLPGAGLHHPDVLDGHDDQGSRPRPGRQVEF